MSWNLNAARVVHFSETPERAPDASEKPNEPFKITPGLEKTLDKVKAYAEATKAKGKIVEAEEMRQKDALKSVLVSKGASYEALSAFEQSYNPKVSDKIAKLIENAKPKFNVRDPKSWESIHDTLMDKKSGQFYSQVYWDQYEPELPSLIPLKKPEEIAFAEEEAEPIVVPQVQVADFSDEKGEEIMAKPLMAAARSEDVDRAIDAGLSAQLRKLRGKKDLKVAGKDSKPSRNVDFQPQMVVAKAPRKEGQAEEAIARAEKKVEAQAVATAQPLPEKPEVALSDEALRKAFGNDLEAVKLFTTLKAKKPEAVKEAMAKFDELVKGGKSNDVAREVVLAMWIQGLTEDGALAQLRRKEARDAVAKAQSKKQPPAPMAGGPRE